MAKRDYPNNYPSVTTILGVLRKVGLENWFKYKTIQFINEKSAKGKFIGTQIHQVIQDYIETGSAKIETEYQDEVSNALKSFMLFKNENPNIKLNRSEIALTSEKYKYNGTIDCTGENGGLLIADWKTSEAKDKDKPNIYDEYLYQVSSYVHLYNENNPDSIIEEAIIVSIAKDKVCYDMHIMNKQQIYECFNEVFLPCLKIYNYQKQKGK